MLSASVICRGIAALSLLSTASAFGQDLSFSQEQVDAGLALYKESCRICHGSSLANGQFGTPLKGAAFTDKWKGKSLGELVSFVYDKMPPDKVMSLTPEQYTAAVAYILSKNDIAVSATAMSTDKQALQSVMLPW